MESRIASQALRDVLESMLRRMRPVMLLVEKNSSDDIYPTLHDLKHSQHRINCRTHVAEVGCCTEAAYAQKNRGKT